MTIAAIELINVYKKFGKKEVIKDLSFSVPKGEVFGLIGPNGAGKTTAIRMMVGLMKMTSGDIRIFNKSIQTNFKEAVQKLGAIVENPEMYPFMTGWQNLKHYARMIPGIGEERIEEVVQLVGLKKPIHEKVSKYSLGMRQRLGVAQALLHRPKLLILDEPTNGLDPSGIREVRQYIRRLAEEEQVAVIVSSHLLSEIELMCDRIGIIQNGVLIATQRVVDDEEVDIRNLREITIEVTEVEKASEILQSEFDLQASVTNNILSFQIEKQRIPLIINAFVKNNLAIYQVATKRLTLEDKFFEAIGENVIE